MHERRVVEFKMKEENSYEVRKKLIPTTVVSLTEGGEVYIWVENFKNVSKAVRVRA